MKMTEILYSLLVFFLVQLSAGIHTKSC